MSIHNVAFKFCHQNSCSLIMTFALKHFHSWAIAALIWSSVLPAATAFSISASEMAEFEPKAIRSAVKGTPSF